MLLRFLILPRKYVHGFFLPSKAQLSQSLIVPPSQTLVHSESKAPEKHHLTITTSLPFHNSNMND